MMEYEKVSAGQRRSMPRRLMASILNKQRSMKNIMASIFKTTKEYLGGKKGHENNGFNL